MTTTDENTIPWPEAETCYGSDGPADEDPHSFEVGGARFFVQSCKEQGVHTGRARYKVACVDCDCILHESTTGPTCNIQGHLRTHHGFKGDLKHVKRRR